MKRKLLFPLALAALLPLAWSSPALGEERLLLQPTELKLKSRRVEPDDPTLMRSQNVIVNLDVLRSAKKLTVPLFDDEKREIEIVRTERIQERGEAWHGRIPGQPLSSVTLVALDRIVMGNIRLEDGRIFEIRYLSSGVHSLREIDSTKFPREAQPLRPKPPKGSDLLFAGMAGMNKCLTDPSSDIDVMVVYTATARAAAGGTDNMVALVYLSVAETNQSYVNSNVNHRVRLVHVTEVNYTETGNINTDLNRLTNADGFIDNVLTLRNTYGADNVVMITNNGGGACGLAWFMDPVSPTFESNAFSVVARACAAANLSFPHELGHNMSADHDCANASSTGPYNYNRGYIELTPSAGAPWRTIMSYPTTPASTRIPWWSNPLVNYPVGLDPMGGACPTTPPYSSDNAQVLNNTAPTVANFRCTSPGIGNVWMKDTWEDSGVEPDPLTAAQDMWQSPYIWVRNTQDTNLVHQHQHQNPEAGQVNWAYVKLHNGSSSPMSGTVEIYATNASTTLTWGSWTLVDTVTVTGMPAFSSKVVEGTWTPPAPGHYCMVALWVSTADPMTSPLTADVNNNTRQNNNVAWRNMNVVDFFDVWFVDAELLVRSTSSGRFNLQIRPFNTATSPSFIQHGQVTVKLGAKLAQLWQAGGSRGNGFRATENGLVLTNPAGAVLENIQLDPKFVDTMTLTFRRTAATPPDRFFLSVRQVDAHGTAVGGVSYEIRNDHGTVTTNPGDPD